VTGIARKRHKLDSTKLFASILIFSIFISLYQSINPSQWAVVVHLHLVDAGKSTSLRTGCSQRRGCGIAPAARTFLLLSHHPFSPTLPRRHSPHRKFKVTRGGGRQFSRDLDPRFRANNPEPESSSEEESSEEEEEEEPVAKLAPEMAALNLKLGNTVSVEEQEEDEDNMSRAERKALKKKQADEAAKKKAAAKPKPESESEEEEEDELLNPFAKKKAEPTRRER